METNDVTQFLQYIWKNGVGFAKISIGALGGLSFLGDMFLFTLNLESEGQHWIIEDLVVNRSTLMFRVCNV